MPEHYDLLIRNGEVFDGSGAPSQRADVGVQGDRIVRVGAIPDDATAGETIDASGHAVAPGFIDVHAHDDTLVLFEPENAGKTMQGVTTVINGNCGSGVVPFDTVARGLLGRGADLEGDFPRWDSYAGYFEAIRSHPPAHNVASLVGHGNLRTGAIGSFEERRPSTEGELAQQRAWLREGLEAGAVGLSTGLIYEPGRYTSLEEIAAVAEECAAFDALYVSHIRGEGATLLDAVAEAIEIGRRAGCGVQISHHKASGKEWWGRVNDSLALIEDARARGEQVTADQYPYIAGSTRLFALHQNGFFEGGGGPLGDTPGENCLLASVPQRPEWEGRYVAQFSDEWDIPDDQAVLRILEEGGGGTIAVQFMLSEDDVRTVMRHETTMVGTDGLGWGSNPHPRHFGTYPRILGRYVREEGVLTLEQAIWKMSGFPATRFQLAGRGFVREGAFADLVVFDPATVIDTATFERPRQAPDGIPHVVVNGVLAVRDGVQTPARAGRPVLRGREE